MSIEKMRQEFEVWAVASAWLGLGEESQLHQNAEGSGYNEIEVHTAWLAWQASRETLVFELPEPFAVIGDYDACGGGKAVWDLDYSEKIDDRMCKKTSVYNRACLEAAGLKVQS